MKNKRIDNRILKIVAFVLIVMFSSMVGVYAERIIASSKVTYNNATSGLSSTNVQGAVDELYANCIGRVPFASYLKSLDIGDGVIKDDGTTDHNMRYTGKTPNNYVIFAGEEWRVIGVFHNVDNGMGIKETRVKIIKSASLGKKQWNTSLINTWKNASLNAELQSLPYASNAMIENAVWYLGDPGGDLPIAKTTYEKERGTIVESGNDPTWIGKVGLMYPSDYGFASSECRDGTHTLRNYNDTICTTSNWLHFGVYEWLLSPIPNSTSWVRGVYSSGRIAHITVTDLNVARPVVYLKSDVICKNCSASNAGTKENPFQIG